MARHGRDAIRADDGLLGLTGSEGSVGGAGTRTTPGGSTEAARQPARFVVIAGRRGRKAILSDMRSVMLGLGDAPAGKADVVPDFQQGLPRSSIRQGRCFGAVRLAFLHAGSVPECPVGRRPQKSPPCGGLCHSRWRTGFRDCPREGARSCLQPGMHAVLSEEGGERRSGGRGLSSHAGEAPSVDARFVCSRSQAWAEAAAVSSSLRAALRRQASLRSRSSRATMVKRLMKARANCR